MILERGLNCDTTYMWTENDQTVNQTVKKWTIIHPLKWEKDGLSIDYRWTDKWMDRKLRSILALPRSKVVFDDVVTISNVTLSWCQYLYYYWRFETCVRQQSSSKNSSKIKTRNTESTAHKMIPPPPPCFVWQSPCFALGNPKIKLRLRGV